MRTIELKVYTFDELSDKAKKRAVNHFRSIEEWYGGGDATASLKKWCSMWGIRLTNYSLGDNSDVSWEFDPVDAYDWGLPYGTRHGEAPHMEGFRLWKWLMNNHSPFSPDEFRKATDGSCPLTGMCYDCTFFDPFTEFLAKPDRHTDLDDLLREGFHRFEEMCNADCEYTFSDEAIIESIQCNEMEFDVNGDSI